MNGECGHGCARAAMMLPVLLMNAELLARAGGGGGYHGGGGGGGGGHGGGGGGGGGGLAYLFYLLIQLDFTHPLIGLPITARRSWSCLSCSSARGTNVYQTERDPPRQQRARRPDRRRRRSPKLRIGRPVVQ